MTENPDGPIIVVLSSSSLPVAEEIKSLSGGEIHGLRDRVERADVLFDDTAHHVAAQFAKKRILIGIMALITGSMVGTAIRFAANPTQGWGPGLTSVAIAFAAIMLGKVGAFYVWSGEMVDDEVTMEDEIAMYTSESGLIAPIADEVHAEWEESGKITEEQMEAFYEEHIEDYEDYEMGADYDHSADYLPEVWAEATKRWQAKSDEEKEQARNQVVKDIRDTWLGDEAEFGDLTDEEASQQVEDEVHQVKIVVATIFAF